MHSADDLVNNLSDINGHVGRNIDGFHGAHAEYGVGQSNLEGLEKQLCVKYMD